MDYLISKFNLLRHSANLNKLLVSTGIWLLVAVRAIGQGCPSAPHISFSSSTDITSSTINICGTIGGGPDATDIDVTRNNSTGTHQWYYSVGNSPYNWIQDPYAGTTDWVVLSFGSTPGHYYFQLKIIPSSGCPGGVYSNIIDLLVNPGTPPPSPTASVTPSSSCSGSVSATFTASGCSGTLGWYANKFGGTSLHSWLYLDNHYN